MMYYRSFEARACAETLLCALLTRRDLIWDA